MNTLIEFVKDCLQGDWTERVGWTLLHSLWQVALIAVVYVAISVVLRHRSASSRYAAGCIALLAMLVAPIVTYGLLPQSGSPLQTKGPAASLVEAQTPDSGLASIEAAELTTGQGVLESQAEAAAELDSTPVVSTPPVTHSASTVTTTTLAGASSLVRPWLPLVTTLWLAGVLLLSLRPIAGWFHVRRLQRRGLSPLADSVRLVCGDLMQRLGVGRAVQFAQSALVEVPTVVGYLRPMVLLPASAVTGLTTAELELVLAHELAHIRRHDYLINVAQTVVEALLFYHPAMWWVSSQVRRERENCCDDVAVAMSGDRATYVRALAQLEQHRTAVPALAATGGSLLQRVRRLLGQPDAEFGYRSATAWLAGVVVMALVVAVLATGGDARGEAEEPAGEIAASTTEVEDTVDDPKLEKSGPEPVAPNAISGIVLGPDEKPLAGVDVNAWTWYPGNEAKTDADGRFELANFDPNEDVEIEFTKDGYCPSYFVSKKAGTRDWVVRMDNRTWLEGRVIDDRGDPVPDVEIRAERGPFRNPDVLIGEVTTTTRADSEGNYRLYLEPDSYVLKLRTSGLVFRQEGVRIAKGEQRTLRIALEKGITFRAKVIDSITGEPVEGITLWNWRNKGIEGTSNAEGLLEIPGMFPGKFDFNITAKGADRRREWCAGDYARWWSPSAVNEHQRKSIRPAEFQRNFDDLEFELKPRMHELEPVTIVVERCAIVRGRVLDPDGNPAAGATVAPAKTGSGNSLTGDTRFSYQTKDDGTFEAKLPASGGVVYNLVAHDGKYGEWRNWANGVGEPFVTLPGQEIEDIELRLTRGATVRGRLLNGNGKPLAQQRVRAAPVDKLDNRYYHPETRTDADGRFELKFIRPGKHLIQAEPFWLQAEQAPGGTSQPVELEAGDVVEGVMLAPPGTIERLPLSGSMGVDELLVVTRGADGDDAKTLPTGLEFLAGIPEFTDLRLDMTEAQLKEIIAQHDLKVQTFESNEGQATNYTITTSTGQVVIVMFRDDECSGIQRMRDEFAQGNVVDGLRLQLSPEKRVVTRDEHEVTFELDAENVAGEELILPQGWGWLEVDEKWYHMIPDSGATKLLELKPGQKQQAVLSISLRTGRNEQWLGGWRTPQAGKSALPSPLILQPGRHTLRVALHPVDGPLPLAPRQETLAYSNPVTLEIPEDDESQAAWGEAVDGVQARLIPKKLIWPEGTPPEFEIEVRTLPIAGDYTLPRVVQQLDVEVDGKWNNWRGGRLIAGYFGHSGDGEEVAEPYKPFHRALVLNDNWGRDWNLTEQAHDKLEISDDDFVAEHPVLQALTPGKHTVRVKIIGELITQPVEIEIVAATEDLDETQEQPPEVAFGTPTPNAYFIAKVVDDETGQPIDSFVALAGTSYMSEIGWQWQPHTIHEFADGQMQWPPPGDRGYKELALRIEARGYRPYQTPAIGRLDGDEITDIEAQIKLMKGRKMLLGQKGNPVALEIRLQRDSGTAYTALLPDGQPAPDAQVAIAISKRHVRIADGKVVVPPLAEDASLRDRWSRPFLTTTNQQGGFTLPSETAPAVVIITHELGIAAVPYFYLPEDGRVTLKAWGTIEGQVLWNDQPGAGAKLDISARTRADNLFLWIASCEQSIVADDQGRFRTDKLPPGAAQVSHVIEAPDDRGSSYRPIQFVEIGAGEPTPLVFGGRGRPVIGRLVPAPDFKRAGDGSEVPGDRQPDFRNVRIRIAPNAPYAGLLRDSNDPTWPAYGQFLASPAGAHYQKADIKIDEAGTFRIDNVPPESYQLFVTAPDAGGKRQNTGYASFTIKTIPGGASDEPYDVGEIEVDLINRGAEQETATNSPQLSPSSDVEAQVLEILQTPYNPEPGGGSWQFGAHQASILMNLASVPQQDKVIDALLKVVDGTLETAFVKTEPTQAVYSQKRLAMLHLASAAPKKLMPLLIKNLETINTMQPVLRDGQLELHEFEVLGVIGEEASDAIPVLVELLDSSYLHETVVRTLVKVAPSSTEVMHAIAKRMDNPHTVYEVGRYGKLAKPLGPQFVELLDAELEQTQIWAAFSLVKSGYDEARGCEFLVSKVAAADDGNRQIAATALAALGSQAKAMIPKLREYEQDSDERVAKEIRTAIRRIQEDDRIPTHAEQAARNAPPASRSANQADGGNADDKTRREIIARVNAWWRAEQDSSNANGGRHLPNGIYRVRPEDSDEQGIQMERSDADGSVVLLHRLTDQFGQAEMKSMANDNTRFRIHLRGAGPFAEGDEIGHFALVVDGVCVMIWGNSDPDERHRMDLSTEVTNVEAARIIAARLGAVPRLREHLGHQMEVTFTPTSKSFPSGEPVILRLEITNSGDEPFSFYDGGQQRGARNNQFGFTAVADAGQGPEVPDSGDSNHHGGKAVLRNLNPGDIFQKEVDITKWFDLSQPGTYKINGHFDIELHDPDAEKWFVLWDDVARGDCLVVIENQ